MRKLIVVGMSSLVLAACSAKEDAPNSAAMSAATPLVTLESASGTWEGKTLAAESDSVMNTWTSEANPDGSGRMYGPGTPDTITYQMKVDADSIFGQSDPYIDLALPPGTPKVFWKAVGRMTDENTMTGTSTLHLADQPDSVLGASRWTSARKQ
jgi:hypothetical protein